MSKSVDEPLDKGDAADSISMHDFLDFLKITCQLSESISGTGDKTDNKKVDYDQLAKNELIQSILDKCNANSQNTNAQADKSESNVSFDKKGKNVRKA